MKTVPLPKRGHNVVFHPRSKIQSARAAHSNRGGAAVASAIPQTPLPVDGTGNMAVSCPMDGNDSLGDCMECAGCHGDNIVMFGQGKPGFTGSSFSLAAIEQQYERVSGGDNGLSEQDLVDRIWKVGLAGVPQAVIVDSIDFDVNNLALTRYLIDQFYFVVMMWDVPDAFMNEFDTGVVFDSPGVSDPMNGHGTPLTDVDPSGRYRIVTWGTWCWASPAFIASVRPECFAVFTPRQFNAQGYDSKGRHVSAQAAVWVSLGGNAMAAAKVVAMFPAVPPTPVPPVPVPPPIPVPPIPPIPVPPVPIPPVPPMPIPPTPIIPGNILADITRLVNDVANWLATLLVGAIGVWALARTPAAPTTTPQPIVVPPVIQQPVIQPVPQTEPVPVKPKPVSINEDPQPEPLDAGVLAEVLRKLDQVNQRLESAAAVDGTREAKRKSDYQAWYNSQPTAVKLPEPAKPAPVPAKPASETKAIARPKTSYASVPQVRQQPYCPTGNCPLR